MTTPAYDYSDRPVGTSYYKVVAVGPAGAVSAVSATSATIAAATPPAPTGLVAAYGFEETTGTSVDRARRTATRARSPGPPARPPAASVRALSFDGVNDLVTVPDANSLDLTTGMTLSAWVRPTALGNWRTVMLKTRPGGLLRALRQHRHQPAPRASSRPPPSRRPRHRGAAAERLDAPRRHLRRHQVRLYVNGALVATRAGTGAIVVSTGALQIGGNTVWTEWFKGLIDEVRVYSRALTATEIPADRDRPVVAGT